MAAVIHNNFALVHRMCLFSKGWNVDSKVFYSHAIKVPRGGYGCIEEMDSTEQQHGGTALTVAASNGHGAIVDELLSAGASPSLALTFEYGRKDIHKLLFAQRSEVRKIVTFNNDEDWSYNRLKEILRYEHVDLIPTTYSSSVTQQQVERRLREVLSGRWLRFNGGCDGDSRGRGTLDSTPSEATLKNTALRPDYETALRLLSVHPAVGPRYRAAGIGASQNADAVRHLYEALVVSSSRVSLARRQRRRP
jgi:hypothetical protein